MNQVILTMGLNHTTAPIAVREQMASSACVRDDALNHLNRELNGDLFQESLVLSTCNRTEIYAVVSDPAPAESEIGRLLVGHGEFGARTLEYLYCYRDEQAIAHLFAVASGIDSLILGESEILGQVRNAYGRAAEHKTIGPVLHQLFHTAIHVGKRAHAETQIGSGARSVAYAAVALARQHLGSLAGKSALVVGAGDMAQRAAAGLVNDGAHTVIVANRTLDRAADLARRVGGSAVSFDDLPATLALADVVIAATAAPHLVIHSDVVQTAMQARPDRPLCLIDMAMPRDIDPEIALPNVSLYNIDDLKQVVDTNQRTHKRTVAEIRTMIASESARMHAWLVARRAAPVITDLRARAEAIRTAEVDKALRRLEHLQLNERDRRVIVALSEGILSKLLAAPTVRLKELVQNPDGDCYVDAVRRLFELETNEQSQLPSAL